jgi:two-component system heavy metal sensor histidine kinase CusS
MNARQAAYLVAGSFLVFAAWEAVQHVWFMDLPMAAYHTASLMVDLVLVLIIALAALAIVRSHIRPEARQQAAQEAVVTALAEDLRPHLVSLLARLRALEGASEGRAGDETRALLEETGARAAVTLDMIEDLVVMAKEAQAPARECGNVSLAELAEQAVASFHALAEDRSVELAVQVHPGSAHTCAAPDAALRLLSNLLGRAVRTAPQGGQVRLELAPDPSRRLVVLSVSDTAKPLLDHDAGLDEVVARHGLVELRYAQALATALGGSARYRAEADGNAFVVSLPARRTAR